MNANHILEYLDHAFETMDMPNSGNMNIEWTAVALLRNHREDLLASP